MRSRTDESPHLAPLALAALTAARAPDAFRADDAPRFDGGGATPPRCDLCGEPSRADYCGPCRARVRAARRQLIAQLPAPRGAGATAEALRDLMASVGGAWKGPTLAGARRETMRGAARLAKLVEGWMEAVSNPLDPAALAKCDDLLSFMAEQLPAIVGEAADLANASLHARALLTHDTGCGCRTGAGECRKPCQGLTARGKAGQCGAPAFADTGLCPTCLLSREGPH